MTRNLTVEEVREDLEAALDLVDEGPVILNDEGRPRAVLLSPEDYERFRGLAKQRLFEAVDAIHQQNADLDPDELEREIAEAIVDVRRERADQMYSCRL